jgi:hypothetical protein
VCQKSGITSDVVVAVVGGSGGLTIQVCAHGGVEGQVQRLDEDVAILQIGGRGDRPGLVLEGLADDDVGGGTLGEGDDGVCARHVDSIVDDVV